MQLVHATTSDQLRLDGAFLPPDSANAPVVVMLHGVGGNFYGSSLMDHFASPLREQGMGILRANTRGHDLVSLAQVGQRFRWEGAAFETVGRCTRDIAAWLGFLRERGYPHHIVWGHSLGALKAIYAAAHEPSAVPDAIVALSPPRLSYAAFMHGPERKEFEKTIERARDLIRQAKHSELLTVRTPFPLLISAAAYLDKYGPDEHYNIERFAALVRCPTLYVYGQTELQSGSTAFQGIVESLQSLNYVGPPPVFRVVEGADHFYRDRYAEAASTVLDWLTSLREVQE